MIKGTAAAKAASDVESWIVCFWCWFSQLNFSDADNDLYIGDKNKLNNPNQIFQV